MPTPAQEALIDAIARALEADPRIESAWLSGSLGRGEGDAWSDVDVTVVLPDGGDFSIVANYDLGPIAPVIFRQVIFGRVINAITQDFLRFDLAFVSPPQLAAAQPSSLRKLFDRGATAPAGARPPTPQSRLTEHAREFLRIMALAPVAMGREDYLVAMEGVVLLRRLTIEAMLEINGVTPAMRGGALSLKRFLTPQQRADLDALPSLAPTRESVLAHQGALARLFIPLAKPHTGDWPEAFEADVRAYLARTLAIDI